MISQRFLSHALALVLVVASVTGAATISRSSPAPSTPRTTGIPNTFNPRSDAASVAAPSTVTLRTAAGPAGPPAPTATTGVATAPSPAAPLLRPALRTLRPASGAQIVSSNGQLEADVPAGAVTAADLAADGGAVSLKVTQTMAPSGTSAGGNGHILLGSYLLQVVDKQGKPVGGGLRQPVTLRLHVPTENEQAATAFVTAVPAPGTGTATPAMAKVSVSALAEAPAPPTVPTATRMTPSSGGALTATVPAVTGTTAVTFATTSPAASDFGTANPFSVDLNSGSLQSRYPIDTPAGPGGLSPSLALNYSSALVSEQHNPMAAASWVGEGWDLSLGEISWKEDQTGQYWESSWHIQDPYGLSDDLVPPSTTTSTYYDLTSNGITAGPLRWHTATESHAKIYSYTGPLSLPGQSAKPPCFRVFLPNGIMEEFGCTLDSLSYYPSDTSYHIRAWMLDLITDRHGDQIHVTYQQDMTTGGTSGKMKYPRDTVMSTVEWDSPGCSDPQAACTAAGSAPHQWTPLMRVSFAAAHAVSRFTGTPTVSDKNGCNALPMRCDDPWYTSPPLQQSTFVLNDALVQVRGGGTASWNTLNDYQFTYQQTGVHQFQDPWTGQNTQAAGQLDLTQLKQVGDDGSTSLPARTFSYTSVTQYYTDMDFAADPGPTVTFGSAGGITVTQNNCGPSWNWGAPRFVYNVTDVNGAIWSVYDCVLWSQSYAGNSDYLASASNGQGLAQSFSWANAYPNVEGVPKISGVQDPGNPLACDGHESTSPCGTRSVYQEWSRAVLTQQSGTVLRASSAGSTSQTSTTSYRYRLTTPVPAQPSCNSAGRCFVATMYWRPLFHFDPGDFNNERFMGFAETDVTSPDGSMEKHHYYTTGGIGMYDTSVPCVGGFCHASAWWSPENALHGREYEDDVYDTDGTTLLGQTKTQYALTCPPAGVAGSPSWKDSKDTDSGFPYTFTWDGQLVTEISNVDPVAVCDIQASQVDTYTFDGAATSTAVPHSTTSYSYDSYGRITASKTTSNDGAAAGSPVTQSSQTTYTQNDSVTATASGVTGTYLIDMPASTTVVSADGSRHLGCTTFGYDGQPSASGQNSAMTLGEVTQQQSYTSCGTSAGSFTPSGAMTVTGSYDSHGTLTAVDDADAVAGDATHVGCTIAGGSTGYSACMTSDSVYGAEPAASQDALGQTTTQGYGSATDPAVGFGLWPVTMTDPNGQVTTVAYDALGRQTSSKLPGEAGASTAATSYADWCSGTAAQTPCVEVDNVKRVDSTTTSTTRTFYDGWGRPVETRTSGPDGQDIVTYTFYDAMGRKVFVSSPYLVPAYTGAAGAAAFAKPDASQPGATTAYPSKRQTKVTNAQSQVTTTTQSVSCAVPSTGDTACYDVTTGVDALGHQQAVFSDAFGRTVYARTFTGNSSSGYTPYSTTTTGYDELGDVTKVVHPDGTSTSYSYDDAGRLTSMTDPNRGTVQYFYDADGNLTETVDARGAAGTTFYGYDGLGRVLWASPTNSPQGAFATYSYDDTANGNNGVGHLTSETFASGGMSGSRSYVYDARGQQTSATLTVAGTSYTTSQTYNDAGGVTSQTYPDGSVVTSGYTGGWLTGLTLQQGGTSTALASGISYNAAGAVTGASAGGGVLGYSASYDLLGRMTDTKLTLANGGTTLFEQGRTFDAAGNVATTATTLPQGTDNQQFCYDEQNRLTWAGSAGTAPCAGTALTPGTLTGAQYTQSFSYDTMDRLTNGPAGAYTYGDPAHPDAVTQAGTSYTASYDVAGNMTCRAPSSSASCAAGTLTGAITTYDTAGRATGWQNAPTAPSQTAGYLYDAEGNRVAQQVTANGATTTTVYVGGLEEIASGGGTTTTTDYYPAVGGVLATSVNGTLSYLATDGLGSILAALDGSGNVTASQLFLPYGATRYQTGTMPTSHGFTGQQNDTVTGLVHDGARQLDPATGQFTSADTVQDGPDGYAYVHGNPETLTDPSGNSSWDPGNSLGASPPSAKKAATPLAKVLVGVALAAHFLGGGMTQLGDAVDALSQVHLPPAIETVQPATPDPLHGAVPPTEPSDEVEPGSEGGPNWSLGTGEPESEPEPAPAGPAPWNDRRTRGAWQNPSKGLYSVQVSPPVPVIESFPVTPSMGSYVLPQPPPPPPALVQPPVTVTPITPQPAGIQNVNTSIPAPGSSPVVASPTAAMPAFDPIAALNQAMSSAINWYLSLPLPAQIAIGIGLVIAAVAVSALIWPDEVAAGIDFAVTTASALAVEFQATVDAALAAAEAQLAATEAAAQAASLAIANGIGNVINPIVSFFNPGITLF